MTALWITLAAIILLLAVILALPVDIVFSAGSQTKARFYVRVLGISLIQQKTKKKKKKDKKKSPASSKVGKLLGGPTPKSGDHPTLKEMTEYIFSLLEHIVRLIKKFKIIKCRIVSISAGENAAVDYGRACALIYPLVSFLESGGIIHRKDLDVNIDWDYDRSDALYEFDVTFRMHIFYLAGAALRLLKTIMETKRHTKK